MEPQQTVIIVESIDNQPIVYVWNKETLGYDLANDWVVISQASERPHETDYLNLYSAPCNVRSYGGMYYLVEMRQTGQGG